MQKLIGKTVEAVYLRNDRETLWFVCSDENVYVYVAEGLCCATCWIEDVINPEFLIDSPILEIVPKKMDLQDASKYWEEFRHVEIKRDHILSIETDELEFTDVWGYSIKTMQGITDIEMRCEHNGFYSGDLEFLTTWNYHDIALSIGWDNIKLSFQDLA